MFRVSIVSVPPCGMASRPLTTRFMSTWCIWPRSALTIPTVRIQPDHQPHILADDALQHGLRLPDQLVEVERPELRDLFAAEGQQLLRQFGAAQSRRCGSP